MTANEITAAALKISPNTASMLKSFDKSDALDAAVESTLKVLLSGIKNGKVTAEEIAEEGMAKQGLYTMLAKHGLDKSLLHQDVIGNIVRMINNTVTAAG